MKKENKNYFEERFDRLVKDMPDAVFSPSENKVCITKKVFDNYKAVMGSKKPSNKPKP